jgi:hypothetical protein
MAAIELHQHTETVFSPSMTEKPVNGLAMIFSISVASGQNLRGH